MNYKPFVSWWFYGGSNATQTANYFASYGLLADAPGTPSGFNLWILISSVWKQVSDIWTLIGGSWKSVTDVSVLSNTWKDV